MLRRRKSDETEPAEINNSDTASTGTLKSSVNPLTPDASSSYFLTRLLIYRTMGFVFLATFITSTLTHRRLISPTHGLMPVSENAASFYSPFFRLLGVSDESIDAVGCIGIFFSLVHLFTPLSRFSFLVTFVLWLCQLSLVNLDSRLIRGYGWEWQILETSFLIIFFMIHCKREAPSMIMIYLLRYLAFRVMLGAGLSKIGARASQCWHDWTCLSTHYETAPLPNPLALFFHAMPMWFHKFSTGWNHFVELILPVAILIPYRPLRLFTAVVQIQFQSVIMSTGNYSTINWITIVPLLSLLDDKFIMFVAKPLTKTREKLVAAAAKAKSGTFSKALIALRCALAVFIIYKSAPAIQELRSESPWLNFYDRFYFVNAYGVFGFINSKRYEPILSYRHSRKEDFVDLEFRCVPTRLNRWPCIIAPIHLRYDWQVWIEGTASLESASSKSRFLSRLLYDTCQRIFAGDRDTALLLGTPLHQLFKNNTPPLEIKADLYLYHFNTPSKFYKTGEWWNRERVFGAGSMVLKKEEHTFKGKISNVQSAWHDLGLLGATVFCFIATRAVFGASKSSNSK